MTNTYIEKKLIVDYSSIMDLLKEALSRSLYLDTHSVSNKSLIGLEAYSLSLSIQMRKDRLKRRYCTKKYLASLQKQGTVDVEMFGHQ